MAPAARRAAGAAGRPVRAGERARELRRRNAGDPHGVRTGRDLHADVAAIAGPVEGFPRTDRTAGIVSRNRRAVDGACGRRRGQAVGGDARCVRHRPRGTRCRRTRAPLSADRGSIRRLGDLRAAERRAAGASRGAGRGRGLPARWRRVAHRQGTRTATARHWTACGNPHRFGRSDPRRALRLRVRAMAWQRAARRARRTHLPDATGSVLLRHRRRRTRIRTVRTADLAGFRSRLLRVSGYRWARIQGRTR